MYKWLGTFTLMCALPLLALADSDAQIDQIRAKLKESLPNFTPDSIKASPIKGFHEVAFGTKILYVSDDARYVFEGVLVDISDGKRNLTEDSENAARKQYVGEVNKQESISFGAKKPRHTITVFTDVDCPYCVKLHEEMDQYASYGIQVNYLLFPRNGFTSPGYLKAISVWCSKDRADALTKAKAGKEIEEQTCDNPVADHYELGKKVGVTGTPAVLTQDGRLMPGYMPAKLLAQRLDEGAVEN